MVHRSYRKKRIQPRRASLTLVGSKRKISAKSENVLTRLEGFEPTTFSSEIWRLQRQRVFLRSNYDICVNSLNPVLRLIYQLVLPCFIENSTFLPPACWGVIHSGQFNPKVLNLIGEVHAGETPRIG